MNWKRVILYGVVTWLIPFVVSVAIFPLKTSTPALFESIMPVVITVVCVSLTLLYFRKAEASAKDGVVLGVVWFAVNIVLDLLLFMEGPMKMSFTDYMMDIGLTYLIIPVITTGFGYFGKK